MELNHSQLKRFFVFIEGFKSPFSLISDLILDDQNGKILGVLIKYQNAVVLPRDIVAWNKGKIVINSLEALADPEDIVVIDKALKKDIWVIENKVYTKSGEYLGKVFDYSFNTNLLSIKNIHVGKSFLGLWRYQNRIIGAEEIVEIKKDKIIVERNLNLVKELGRSEPMIP